MTFVHTHQRNRTTLTSALTNVGSSSLAVSVHSGQGERVEAFSPSISNSPGRQCQLRLLGPGFAELATEKLQVLFDAVCSRA